MSECACGKLATVIVTYDDGTVEPVCEDCFEIKLELFEVERRPDEY